MATTPTAVREALVTAIEALVPTTLEDDLFSRYELTKAFVPWAEHDTGHCFRKFELVLVGPLGAPGIVSGTNGRWRYRCELAVAYPRGTYKTLGTTVGKPRLAIDQARAEDFAKIWPVLRDYGAAACVASEAEFPLDDDDHERPENAPVFLRIRVPFEFFQTV